MFIPLMLLKQGVGNRYGKTKNGVMQPLKMTGINSYNYAILRKQIHVKKLSFKCEKKRGFESFSLSSLIIRS